MRRRFLNKRYSPINTDDFLTIYALSDNLQVSLNNDLEYCIDGDGNWIFLSGNELTKSINAGQTISFKGDCKVTDTRGIGSFTITQPCNLQGNILSIVKSLNVNNFKKHYLFYRLFANTPIIDAYKLVIPFLNLAYGCYHSMFYGCTRLITAPELPATTLEIQCYQNMFYGCTNLTTAPELPATTLADNCYYGMFYGCTKLNYIKMLATDISASNCLNNWVNSVASTGTFVKNKKATWNVTGASGVPRGWTIQKV